MQRIALWIGAEKTSAFLIIEDDMSGRRDDDTGIGNTGRPIFELEFASILFKGFLTLDFLFQLCGKFNITGEDQ